MYVDDVVQTLHAMGLDRSDRIALVLLHGPEMAVAFLAVAESATCAPLNPAYGAHEFDFYLADLHAKALMIQAGMDSPARAIAQARGLRIIELSPVLAAAAGLFTLTGDIHPHAARHEFTQPNDVALVLYTSGTTSRPKLAPLTHANICTAAYDMRVAVALDASDRCLNVLPLFHISGLVTVTLASLMAGASITYAPGFSVPKFFAWMAECRPTWYPAVPTIHQAILARAAANREIIAHCPLRFIRSSAAPLPPPVRAKLLIRTLKSKV